MITRMSVLTRHSKITFWRKTGSAFTLVEMLVTLAIVGIMATVLMASISKARESGRNAKCINNLKQIGLSVQLYADENSLQLPPFYYSTTAVGGGQYALT